MAGYCGNERQRALQARTEIMSPYMKETPGACNTGRFIGVDDPDLLGWNNIFGFIETDGLVGFRLVDDEAVGAIEARLSGQGYRIDFWDVFSASREDAAQATQAVLDEGCPDGYREMPNLESAEHPRTIAFQKFLVAAGIAPFSGSMLTGTFGSTVNVGLLDNESNLAATAHGYLPHNAHSRFRDWAWGGLVAVAPTHRGLGLGVYVNALLVSRILRDLGVTHVYELVAADNPASRQMVKRSGLAHNPALRCGIAARGGERFTR
jgi:GNAT superfamily N-acetyltransferase